MIALILCGLAFGITFLTARRSVLAGLASVIGVGYFYGIIRANIPSTISYFTFDAAVVAFYLSLPWSRRTEEDRKRTRQLRAWLAVLIGWPLIMLLIPIQDPLVQLVGLRANIFLLPFLLVGAQLRREEVDRLALYLAGFNLVAFGFGVAEFFLGVPRFYPRNVVTELIYRSNDIRATGDILGAFRIPATFANSSSYGAMMVITIPILFGAWVQRSQRSWRRWVLTLGLAATVLGVFLAASRTHLVVLLAMLSVTMLSGQLGVLGRSIWFLMLAGLTAIVLTNERLFLRLMSVSPQAVIDRISVSVNQTFLNYAFEYPMGNGLGGGGSSLPAFLQHLVRNPVWIESQYATIMFEQGLPGLFLWVVFIVWALSRRTSSRGDPWFLGRRLAWLGCVAYFANGLIGIGFLTAVPFSVLLLASTGWIAVRQSSPTDVPESRETPGAQVSEVVPSGVPSNV